MRAFDIVTEAPRLKPQGRVSATHYSPQDTSGFAAEITALMQQFASLTDATFRFKRDWADRARRDLSAKKLQWERDPENGPFYQRENLEEIVDKIWNEERDGLIPVASNARHAEQEYQTRAAERHGREDDLDFYIEASDYLRGMNEMVSCASDLQYLRPLSAPRVAQQIIVRCKSFVINWDRHSTATDGGEAPLLDEDFINVIERLLPLMLLLFSAPLDNG